MYSWTVLEHLLEREAALYKQQQTTAATRAATEKLLLVAGEEQRGVLRLRRELEAGRRRIEQQRRRVERRARGVEEASGILEALMATSRKRPSGASASAVTTADSSELEARIGRVAVVLRQDRIIVEDLRAMLGRRRAQVARDLSIVYPIELSLADADQWTINGLRVLLVRRAAAAGVATVTVVGEETAAALGMVARAVDLVGRTMNVPLRYPIVPRGSRSIIVNPLKAPKSTTTAASAMTEWPLFMLRNGVADKSRLKTAIRLLRVDIEQLLVDVFGIALEHTQVDDHAGWGIPNLVLQLLLAMESSSFAV